ncbi:MAG: ABC transporter permease, partial [Gemmatimonadota bacterium]|nr:ABC transporter permease [Gemmatimonadota bacterium]
PKEEIVQSMLTDLRYAARMLRRAPTFTAVAVLTLALGIGATTAIFSVVEGIVLRSLPFREPEQLVSIAQIPIAQRGSERSGGTSSMLSVESVKLATRSFEDVAAFIGEQPILTGIGDAERLKGWYVPANFFALLGARTLVGRTFVPEEERAGAPAVIVISYGFWASHFASAPDIVGRRLRLDGRDAEIVGVMPAGFQYPAETQLWRAIGSRPPDRATAAWTSKTAPQGGFWIIARLRRHVTIEQTRAELDAIYRRVQDVAPNYVGWVANPNPLKDTLVGPVRKPLLMMLGAVTLVLLVACANVANLLLARAVSREREMAVRSALGASRARVARQLLTESVALAFAGGTLGVLVAWRAVPVLVALAGSELPRVSEIGMNPRVLESVTLAMVITGILFGLAPALQGARTTSAQALREGGSGATASGWRVRTSDVFAVLQVALTMVLLTGAGLLGASFTRLMRVDLGVETAHVLTAHLVLPKQRYSSKEQKVAFAAAALERLRSIPGVRAAAVSTGIPLASGAFGSSISVDGQPEVEKGMMVTFTAVTQDYFSVFNMPLKAGRFMHAGDPADASAIVINEALAAAYFPGVNPIGHRVSFFMNVSGTIVGVVANTREFRIGARPTPALFHPFDSGPESYIKVSARTSGDPAAAASAVRRAIREVDPVLPIDKLLTMRALIAESVTRQRFFATLVAVFAAVALTIAASGIYALVTYIVSRRTRELGIRIALGADRREVLSLVMRCGMMLTAVGVTVGVIASLALTRMLASLLYEVTPSDPGVLAGVAALLTGVALIACVVPARRALRLDPIASLRSE